MFAASVNIVLRLFSLIEMKQLTIIDTAMLAAIKENVIAIEINAALMILPVL